MAPQDLGQGLDEGVETAVAAAGGGVAVGADAHADTGGGGQVDGAAEVTGQQLDVVVVLALQDLGDDEGQVVGGDGLLGVAQFHHPLQDLALILLRQADIQPFQVLGQGGLAGQLAEGVLAPAGEALRAELGMVETGLAIAVGMDARGLGEDILADDGGIVGDALAGEGLHQFADPGQVGLVDGQLHPQMVAQVDGDLRQGGIAGALAETVDGAVHRRRPGPGRGQDVGGGQAIVVVGVEIEAQPRKALDHVAHGGGDRLRGHDAQGIGQHDVAQARVRQPLHQTVDIVAAIPIAVRPIL